MAFLRARATGRRIAIGGRTLVGRSPGCDLHLDDPIVSGEHAVILWEADGWAVRDLGSRNGTWVGTERLDVGRRRPMRRGDAVTFATEAHTWELVDAGPPAIQAENLDDDRLVAGTTELLALPDDEHVAVTVFRGGDGRWLVEAADGGAQLVGNGAVVEAGGTRWRLHLPAVLPPTVAAVGVEGLSLSFRVSPDEEHVEVALVAGGEARLLRPRSHHYLLLTLARERLGDAPRAEGGRGWVTEERLADMLRVDRQTVKVQIHRARQELAAYGVAGAAGIIERRAGSGQMRIGVSQLAVQVG